MILTDREIEAALSHKQISITPPPKPEAFSSTSVDLTLLSKIRIWKKEAIAGIEICPANQGYNYAHIFGELAAAHEIGASGQVIGSGDFVLAWTAEQVTLPITARLAARVEGKSSLARLGIGVHVTAPTIHAGFSGPIQLEICNHGPLRVKLTAGMPVCQLIFEQTLGIPQKGYKGQFMDQEAR